MATDTIPTAPIKCASLQSNTSLSSSEKSAILSLPVSQLHFRLVYFGVASMGATARDLLSRGLGDGTDDISWENIYPSDWVEWMGTLKGTTPFGVLPILKVSRKQSDTNNKDDHAEVILSESAVVNKFLAKKLDLMGDNEYESQLVDMFFGSMHSMLLSCADRVVWTYKESVDKARDRFLNTTLPAFIAYHEAHLADNNNNHNKDNENCDVFYVGNRLSLADVHLNAVLDLLEKFTEGQKYKELIDKTGPLLRRVQATVLKDPRIARWRSSEEYAKESTNANAMYANASF